MAAALAYISVNKEICGIKEFPSLNLRHYCLLLSHIAFRSDIKLCPISFALGLISYIVTYLRKKYQTELIIQHFHLTSAPRETTNNIIVIIPISLILIRFKRATTH